MSEELIQYGNIYAHWNAAGTRILKYSVEMYHKGLNEHKLISAPDDDILQNKIDLQAKKWFEKWELIETKRRIKKEQEADVEEANKRTKEAQAALEQIENLLTHTLSVDDTVKWESLKKREKFAIAKPQQPHKKQYKEIPPKPDKNSSEFIPQFNLIACALKFL